MDHECRLVRGAHHDAGPLGSEKYSRMRLAIISLFVLGALVPVQSSQKFSGIITDGMCPKADHSRMRMGATDAECAIACVDAHGALYVLYDGNEVFTLSDQQTSEKFAGKKVIVTGELDTKTKLIRVSSITPAAN